MAKAIDTTQSPENISPMPNSDNKQKDEIDGAETNVTDSEEKGLATHIIKNPYIDNFVPSANQLSPPSMNILVCWNPNQLIESTKYEYSCLLESKSVYFPCENSCGCGNAQSFLCLSCS